MKKLDILMLGIIMIQDIHFLISIKQLNILIIQGMIEIGVKSIISIKIRMIYIQL